MRIMKDLSMLIAIALLIAACSMGEPAEDSAPPEAVESPAAEVAQTVESEKTPEEKPAMPASDLKPGDVTADNPVDATELRNAIFQDLEAWKGKEVSVKGHYNGHSTSKTSYGKSVWINIQNDEGKIVGKCGGEEDPPDDVKERRKDRVFRGKVSTIMKAFEQFELEECKMTG